MASGADRSERRQLGIGGPWVLGPSPSRIGYAAELAVFATVCPDPGCECREATLRAFLIGSDAGTGVLVSGEEIDPQTLPALTARIDIDSGEIAAEGADERQLLDRLRAEIDGAMLDSIHERWLRAKGLQRSESFVDGPWSADDLPGRMVGYREPFPDERCDVYRLDGVAFMAEDFYCVTPSCDCAEVRVSFLDTRKVRSAPLIGSVVYDLAKGRPAKIELAARRWRGRVADLWNAFERRHALPAHLARRMEKMKEVGRALGIAAAEGNPPARAGVKIGRNEPCPCGSGRKYKRCCAAATPA
jgi:SEC-C motif-containing protein